MEKKTTSKEKQGTSASAATKKQPVKKTNTKKTTTRKSAKKIEEKGLLVEAAENIEAGAKIVGEKASELAADFAEKTSLAAGSLFDKVKKGLDEAYKTGSKVAENIAETAHDFSEKYKHKAEMKHKLDEQDELYKNLGSTIHQQYKPGTAVTAKMFQEKGVKDLLQELDMKQKEIVKLGREIEKTKK